MKKLMLMLLVLVFVGAAFAAPAEPYRLAFVTLPVYQAVETDIAVYNGWMQDEADNVPALAALGATWTVIASTADVDARDNTGTNPNVSAGVPIYLVDGVTKVADDNADLWDGDIDNIINQIAAGGATPGHLWAYTGGSSLQDGTKADGINNAGGPLGTTGEVVQGNGGDPTTWAWRMWTSDPGTTSLPLYAISSIIPEPATMLLLGLGGLLLRRKR
jgi:hypothetical protein